MCDSLDEYIFDGEICLWVNSKSITLNNDFFVLCNVNCDGKIFKDYCGRYVPINLYKKIEEEDV